MLETKLKKGLLTSFIITCSILPTISFADDDNKKNIITVTAYGKTSIIADTAKVTVAVETMGQNANSTRKKIAQTTAKVLEEISGDKSISFQTSQMNIWPQYDPKQRNIILNYMGNQQITFTSKVDMAGKLIDKAMEAGANKMSGYILIPSDEATIEGKMQALKIASQNAKKQIKTVLENFNLEDKGIYNIEIIDYDQVQPYHNRLSSMAMKSSAETTITEGNHDIKAGVKISIKFEED